MRPALAICLVAAIVMPDYAAASPRGWGKRVESGIEKNYRFRTLVREKRTWGDTRTGFVRMFLLDISGGDLPRAYLEWWYVARCDAAASQPAGITTESTRPPAPGETFVEIAIGREPSTADRTWYNVWYAVCRGESNKYPRNQE